MPRGDGYDQIFLRDPDGHVIELFQFTGEDQSDAPLREPESAARSRRLFDPHHPDRDDGAVSREGVVARLEEVVIGLEHRA